ncbi:MAG: chemotaxis protein CheW [Planctomycetota bacterium]|nr:MAG: chemotaxis protein CheW [Planctomycetota bacterium]
MQDPEITDEFDGELDEDAQKNQFLTFQLGTESYGIAICHVLEIVTIQKITGVPDMPPYIKGVINLRGQVIPVMDVRLRFNMEFREYDDRTCVVVVQQQGHVVGLVVDTVAEVNTIPEENIAPPPRSGRGGSDRFFEGLGKIDEQIKILLDVERLLESEREAFLSSAPEAAQESSALGPV